MRGLALAIIAGALWLGAEIKHAASGRLPVVDAATGAVVGVLALICIGCGI